MKVEYCHWQWLFNTCTRLNKELVFFNYSPALPPDVTQQYKWLIKLTMFYTAATFLSKIPKLNMSPHTSSAAPNNPSYSVNIGTTFWHKENLKHNALEKRKTTYYVCLPRNSGTPLGWSLYGYWGSMCKHLCWCSHTLLTWTKFSHSLKAIKLGLYNNIIKTYDK